MLHGHAGSVPAIAGKLNLVSRTFAIWAFQEYSGNSARNRLIFLRRIGVHQHSERLVSGRKLL
jgi:hypothetical protein